MNCTRCGQYPDCLLPICGPCQRELAWLEIAEKFRYPEPVGKHGRNSTRLNYGCDCESCRATDTPRTNRYRYGLPLSQDVEVTAQMLQHHSGFHGINALVSA